MDNSVNAASEERQNMVCRSRTHIQAYRTHTHPLCVGRNWEKKNPPTVQTPLSKCHDSKICFMVKHLCCCEVHHRPSPSQWVAAPWHMLLGIKPDRNHGYWTQKNYCGGVFDLSLCVHVCVCVCLNSVWTAWSLRKLSARGTKAQRSVRVWPSPWLPREEAKNNNLYLPQLSEFLPSPLPLF